MNSVVDADPDVIDMNVCPEADTLPNEPECPADDAEKSVIGRVLARLDVFSSAEPFFHAG